jgi:hypothetical protein
MLTTAEIAAMAERICKARDRDQRDARAMMRQISLDHGDDALRTVIRQMKRLDACRHAEAMKVFQGMPNNTSFGDALRIKRERGDRVAEGWELHDGTYAKLARRA